MVNGHEQVHKLTKQKGSIKCVGGILDMIKDVSVKREGSPDSIDQATRSIRGERKTAFRAANLCACWSPEIGESRPNLCVQIDGEGGLRRFGWSG